MRPPTAFAIPGALDTHTGGYIYERRLLESLPEIGQPMHYVPLMTSWPHPTLAAQQDLAEKLAALPDGMALILDGLVFGAMDTDLLASLDRPVIAMLHHPLGLEAGLEPDIASALIRRERDNLRHAAHVVVPSAHTRDILISRFDVPSTRISTALPGFDRPPAATVAIPKAQPPLILSVGIICERKGHDILLQALSRIAHLDWRASIVGLTHDDQVRRKLWRLRADLGLQERVDFTGEITATALDGLFRQASIFALATRYEGYGMVLSEAQLYGLPIVSCAVGAVPQTVPAGSGLLTPPDDPAAFADALGQLLSKPELHARIARNSASVGHALPRWQDTARVMRDALDHVRSA